MDALGATGGVVALGAGTYALPIALPANVPITLQGQGIGATELHQASSSADGITGSDVQNLVIRDLTISGPGPWTGTGSGINLTVSGTAGNATFYVDISNVHVKNFGVDGVSIETPIVSQLSRVRAFQNGRHGIHLHSTGDLAGTSTNLEACFPAGNHGAGIRLKQQCYTSLNGCAGDANGIAYEYDTCQGITENGCGSEEPYDFTAFQTGYVGYSRRIFNSKITLNSPYAIGNIGTAYYVTNLSKVVFNSPYEGSPGNADSPTNNPTASIKVDSGCTVAVLNPALVTATDYAAGTTKVLPDDLTSTSLPASQQATLGADASMTASSTNTLLTLTLTAGTWLITGTVTLQQGAGAGNTDIRILAGTATLSGATSSTIRAASASQPAAGVVTARVVVTAGGTVLLNAYPTAAATAKAATAANSIPGATSLQAVPLPG